MSQPASLGFRVYRFLRRRLHLLATVGRAPYRAPDVEDLRTIEQQLQQNGIALHDLRVNQEDWQAFRALQAFPADYHGGEAGGVVAEKQLEHFLSFTLLGLRAYRNTDLYVDIAACASPWVKYCVETLGLKAFAIDLEVPERYRSLPCYMQGDATRSPFATASVHGASLHCAFEMFNADQDLRLLDELARILAPGGKCVIVPLYLHTHHCGYASPDCYHDGHHDSDGPLYVRRDTWGVPYSRKYSAATLRQRILDRITELGMSYRLSALRNGAELGDNIYCHFILEIEK